MPVLRYGAVLLRYSDPLRSVKSGSFPLRASLTFRFQPVWTPPARDTGQRSVASVNTDAAASCGTFVSYSQRSAPAARRFALQRMRFIFSACVSLGDIKRHRSRFSSHLILRKLSRPVMNHFIFFSGWWRQAFPSQTHCVPLLKGPQTVIQNIRYYVFPSAGKIITGPSVALFSREPCTRAPRPLCCFYFLLKTICNVRKKKRKKKGATF